MKCLPYILTLAFVLCLSACETSRTYYGETANDVNKEQQHYRLDLSNKRLVKLPDNILQQTELRTLNLSGNLGLDITKTLSTICQLPNLHILILNDLQLNTLPEAIKDCHALTQISLVNNPNLSFNEAFTVLSSLNLEFVDLSNNQLSEIPKTLGNLKTLRDLRLSNNHIHQANSYQTLAKLPRLFSLWLDNNELTKLPKEIGLLNTVGYLYLDDNYLTKLPPSMRFMRRLSAIWLGHNCFDQVPVTLADRGILMAFLNNNKITDIGERFRTGHFFVKGIVLDYNYLDNDQRKESAKIFNNTFIYSDDNQYQKSTLKPCANAKLSG
jgi:Leucine-rich repeat (LRR) protein